MNSVNRPGARRASGIRADLVVVLALELALVVALHLSAGPTYHVPVGSLADWVQTTDLTVALVALARLAALGIGYWLLATTVLYALAHQLGWHSMTAAMRWITLPVIRRVVQGVTAMSLTGASLMGPAVSAGPALAQDAIVAQASEGSETTATSDGTDGTDGTATTDGTGTTEGDDPDRYVPDAAGWPRSGADTDFWQPTPIPTAAPAQPARTHVAARGDHLWGIAETTLRAAVDHDPTEDEICQYWVRVIEANRDTLRSGDPDMIQPGEQIVLPDVFSQ